MLKHLQELIAADGETTAAELLVPGKVLKDCAITHADEIGIEAVDDDGARLLVPWAAVRYIKIVL